MIMRRFFYACLVALLAVSLHSALLAQPSGTQPQGTPPAGFNPALLPKIGKISGSVVNKLTKQPVEFATVAVFRGGDPKPVSGAIANKQGYFSIDKLTPGRYRLKISFISFTAKFIDSVVITPKTPERFFETILLEPNITALKDVEVTAEKEAVQYAVDRKIYNVEKDLTTTGGSAVDVLQNIPSITVDVDRNISLRGSNNVTILVDGRPSTLMLEQIPADNIERIEVITNPSAKFDPDGTAGIVNIILKKNQQAGYNGNVSLSAGIRDKYNASTNLNFRNESLNAFVNYNYNANSFFFRGDNFQKNTISNPFYITQYTDGTNKRDGHGVRAGLDFFLDDFNTLTTSFGYNTRQQPSFNLVTYDFLNAAQTLDSTQKRTNQNDENGHNWEANLVYKKTFANPQQLFTADARFSSGTAVSTLTAAQASSISQTRFQDTRSNEKNYVINIQADYEHPFDNGMKLETGIKTIVRRLDNDFLSESATGVPPEFKPDANLTNHFIYDEQVYSGYGVLTGAFDNLSYSVGLRAEQTLSTGDQQTTNQKFDNNYFNLFPSLALKYKLPDEHEIGLSYSRRIRRPSSNDLNPFPQYTDPYNLRTGNPQLKPEYISSVEVSYLKFFGSFSLNPSVFYRFTDGAISPIRTVNAQGVTETRPENLNTSNSVGAEIITQWEIAKWWKLNAAGSYFFAQVNANNIETGLSNKSSGGNARLTTNIRTWEDFDVQISYNYFLPTVLAQGTFKPFQAWDAAVKKDFLENRLTVTLRMSDVFDTRQFGITTNGAGFSQDFTRKRESQILFLGISYRFSGGIESQEKRQQRKREREERDQSPDENFQ